MFYCEYEYMEILTYIFNIVAFFTIIALFTAKSLGSDEFEIILSNSLGRNKTRYLKNLFYT